MVSSDLASFFRCFGGGSLMLYSASWHQAMDRGKSEVVLQIVVFRSVLALFRCGLGEVQRGSGL